MLKVDLNKCIGCGECEEVCTFGAITISEDKAKIDLDTCTLCGTCVDTCPEEALEIASDAQGAEGEKDLSNWKGVWVIAELRKDGFAPVTFELLGKARQLADTLSVSVTALVIGSSIIKKDLQGLIYRGADRVIVVDHPKLSHFIDEAYSKIVTCLVQKEKPEIVLAGATAMGRAFIPQVATMLETGLTADCTALEIEDGGRNLLQTRPAFGGNLMATIICDEHRPQMATVRPHVLKAMEADTSRKGEIIEFEPPEELLQHRVKVLDSVIEEDTGPNLTDAEIVVTAGRGLEKKENLHLVEKLAGCLEAGIGATRAITDAGWISTNHQIGQTGVTVSPKLYIACGVSGAIQHLVGMQGSDIIVAINKDKDAPIFDIATYAIVADVKEILPILIKKICKERGVKDV